jgi:hypothetical protein
MLGLWWQVAALRRKGGGFDFFPTGLWLAVRKAGRVLIPVAVTYWIFTPGFGKSAEYVLGRGLFESGDAPAMLWRVLWTPDVLWAVYLAPLVFLTVNQEANRRTKYLALGWAGVSLVYGVFLRPLWEWGYLHVTRPAGFPIFYILRNLMLGGVFVTVWNVFVPLCLLRWWVRGRFLRPLLVLPAAFLVAFGPSAVFPELHEGRMWSFFLMQAAAVAVVVLSLLIPDVPPRGDTVTGMD